MPYTNTGMAKLVPVFYKNRGEDMKEKIKHLLESRSADARDRTAGSFLTPVMAYGRHFMMRGFFHLGTG